MARDSHFGDRLPLKQYLAASHIVVATYEGVQTIPDKQLAAVGVKRSSCIRAPYFGVALRHEFTDHNPITLVRQSAKRRTVPVVLLPSEINLLVPSLRDRERTLVLLAAGTGLRMSELFGLKWGDVDFAGKQVNVLRSIVNSFRMQRLLRKPAAKPKGELLRKSVPFCAYEFLSERLEVAGSKVASPTGFEPVLPP